MRVYLVDGSNAVRRGNYDPRFPDVEEAETESFLARLDDLASPYAGQIRIEVFFDGPARKLPKPHPPVALRFPVDGYADDAILGSVRHLRHQGRGAVAVTEDGGLARELEAEGARVIGFGELMSRLRSGHP